MVQIAVSLVVVLAVIVVSVVYALRKSQGENIVEALRADAI